MTADILARDQSETPETLLEFFKVLYTGSVVKGANGRVQRYKITKATRENCLCVGSRSNLQRLSWNFSRFCILVPLLRVQIRRVQRYKITKATPENCICVGSRSKSKAI